MAVLALLDIFSLLISVLIWLMIAQFVLSLLLTFNVINMHSPGVSGLWRALDSLLEPIYRPVRRLVPPVGGMDFSPMVVIILLNVLKKVVTAAAIASIT
ncbi:MAG: YggT family protein [Novosphingobium sp.]|uniref:YggT family protein n=1 Tax=Novosphingobium sp. TaxID=1874826 RepID=UPI0032B89030